MKAKQRRQLDSGEETKLSGEIDPLGPLWIKRAGRRIFGLDIFHGEVVARVEDAASSPHELSIATRKAGTPTTLRYHEIHAPASIASQQLVGYPEVIHVLLFTKKLGQWRDACLFSLDAPMNRHAPRLNVFHRLGTVVRIAKQ